MRDWCREFYVAHTLSPHYRASNFNSTFFTDDIFITNSAVFSAVTFIIFFRTENFLVKETPALGSARAVIYRFRLGNFSKGPLFYLFWRCKPEPNLIKFSCV